MSDPSTPESPAAPSKDESSDTPRAECETCGAVFEGEHADKRYSAHFRSDRHKKAAEMSAALRRILLWYGRLTARGAYLGLPDETSESATERDGAFSYAVEWHAVLLGLGMGLWLGTSPKTALPVLGGLIAAGYGVDAAGGVTKRIPEYIRREVRKELHYFVGGVAAGYAAVSVIGTPVLSDLFTEARSLLGL